MFQYSNERAEGRMDFRAVWSKKNVESQELQTWLYYMSSFARPVFLVQAKLGFAINTWGTRRAKRVRYKPETMLCR